MNSTTDPDRRQLPVIGIPIDVVSATQAVGRIARWARDRESRSVCICNVHSVVTAQQDTAFRSALANSDMNTPDGAPVAWALRRLGSRGQQRVSGPDLMIDYCGHAASAAEGIFLYGSTEETLSMLAQQLRRRWPELRIAGSLSPPFRELSPDEDADVVRQINDSGAATVWVGLGCPKQELWMAAHRGKVHAVMIGVGAAFEFLSGKQRRAPQWMRHAGLEWLFRLIQEPRRLWRRYLYTNSVFIFYALRAMIRSR